ncbi:MAG: sugar phosphate isomerase/epimerase [Methanobrevibacter sp.]|nr:sugar phosphate isomerase/epimerase [Candidatus Methanoflexus mossambicus]
MKFGISTLASKNESIEDFLDFVSDLKTEYYDKFTCDVDSKFADIILDNIDNVELLLEYPNDNPDIEILESYSFKYSIHAPISDVNIASTNKAISKTSINEIKRSADYLNSIGGDILVVHPGTVAFSQRRFEDKAIKISKEAMKICGDYAKDLGVEICFENMPKIEGFLFQNSDELNNFLVDNDFSMTYDIGHKNTVDGKTSSYYKSVKHIHLHDNDNVVDEHLSLGDGKIDFLNFFKTYDNHNFNGVYVLELNDKESILNSINYFLTNHYNCD